MARIDAFLKLGVAQGCSDLHLAVGVPPMLRMHGDLMPIKFRNLGDAELESYITEVLTQSQLKVLRDGNDLDFSYVSTEGGRFRVNVYRKETGIGARLKLHPTGCQVGQFVRGGDGYFHHWARRSLDSGIRMIRVRLRRDTSRVREQSMDR